MASLDTRRLQRLLPYLAQDRRRLWLALLLLIPLALAGALQPLLVKTMETAHLPDYVLNVPLVVDTTVGHRWG
jgi:hypothetical protein